jgi:hypothetical protein
LYALILALAVHDGLVVVEVAKSEPVHHPSVPMPLTMLEQLKVRGVIECLAAGHAGERHLSRDL